MNSIKRLLSLTTGYWTHKIADLPVGADLFIDIYNKVKYPSLNVLFDVGANTGQTRHWLRYYVPKAKIYSFEPVKDVYQQLLQNSAGDANCVLENFALGEARGEKTIQLFEGSSSSMNSLLENVMNNTAGARKETVQIETIDQYSESNAVSKIDLLKIDTEGYEIHVLKGASRMLNQGAISMIYCETGFQSSNQCNTYFPKLTDFLEKQNYYFFGLYQIDYHDWHRGNHLGNALYIHKSVFP